MGWVRKHPRKAKFPGQCSVCQQEIEVGVEIAWKPGEPADHWPCYQATQLTKRGEKQDRAPGFTTRWYTGSGARDHSELARRDQEAVRRAMERSKRT